jgi:hypothetical protein
MLVEIKTLYGPVRLSMPKSAALTVGRIPFVETRDRSPAVTLGSPLVRVWPAGSGECGPIIAIA